MPVVSVSRILITSFGNMIICLWLSFYIQAKSGSSHTKDAMEEMNCHLAQTFAQDFPFYLVLAYRMYKWGNDLYSSALLCTHCLLACYIHPYMDFLTETLKSTNVNRWIHSSGAALRRWRSWTRNRLPSPSWVSSTGEHSVSRVGILYDLIWSETDWCWLTKMLHFTKLAGYVLSSLPTRIFPSKYRHCQHFGYSAVVFFRVQYSEYSS